MKKNGNEVLVSPVLLRRVLHVVLAAAFFFSLQRFMMKESLEVSLLWAGIGGAGAAWLAWRQG